MSGEIKINPEEFERKSGENCLLFLLRAGIGAVYSYGAFGKRGV